jgi:hypothetical protein
MQVYKPNKHTYMYNKNQICTKGVLRHKHVLKSLNRKEETTKHKHGYNPKHLKFWSLIHMKLDSKPEIKITFNLT